MKTNTLDWRYWLLITLLVLAGGWVGYQLGFAQGRTQIEQTLPQELPPETSMTPAPSFEPTIPEGTACTLDAKICPDGSAVGRTGPDCEFAPCP